MLFEFSCCSSTVFNQVKSLEEITLSLLPSTQILVLSNCPVHHFPVAAKDRKKRITMAVDGATSGWQNIRNELYNVALLVLSVLLYMCRISLNNGQPVS
jgi:hypothetical protein